MIRIERAQRRVQRGLRFDPAPIVFEHGAFGRSCAICEKEIGLARCDRKCAAQLPTCCSTSCEGRRSGGRFHSGFTAQQAEKITGSEIVADTTPAWARGCWCAPCLSSDGKL